MTVTTVGREAAAGLPARRPPQGKPRRSVVHGSQAALILVVLAAWQWLPSVHALSADIGLLNRSFISSPGAVGREVGSLIGGTGSGAFWAAIGDTLRSTVLGCLIAVAAGLIVGLLLSQSPFLAGVLRPFITAFNATPLIAFIPIIVVLFGVSLESSMLSAALLSVFVIFFNALEGGRSVRAELLSNARLLGAGHAALIFRVRLPYAMAWMFAAMPAAISFALVGCVATEFLVGVPGIGQLLTLALSYRDPALVLALAVLLGVLGALLVGIVWLIRHRLMHWWEAS